ncbi:Beta-galactosidase, partial [Thalictrum thalictroides]
MLPVWQGFPWMPNNEETASYYDNSIATVGLMEQTNTTTDASGNVCVIIGSNEAVLRNGNYPELAVQLAWDEHVFINGQLSGTAYGGMGDPKLD